MARKASKENTKKSDECVGFRFHDNTDKIEYVLPSKTMEKEKKDELNDQVTKQLVKI
jgi:hypothetical protein